MYRFVFSSRKSLEMFIDFLKKEGLLNLTIDWSNLYKNQNSFPFSVEVNEYMELRFEESKNPNIVEYVFKEGVRQIRNEKNELISETKFLDCDSSLWILISNAKRKIN